MIRLPSVIMGNSAAIKQSFLYHETQYISDSALYFVEIVLGGQLTFSKHSSLRYDPEENCNLGGLACGLLGVRLGFLS